MSILKNLTFTQRVALALLFGACVAVLLMAVPVRADELTMWPSHVPFKADAGFNPYLLGLLCVVVAIFFI